MQKEDIFALIDQLTIDQANFNKFKEYVCTFVGDKRCRAGIREFIKEVFNLPQIAGLDELCLGLTTDKSYQNANRAEHFIFTHPITTGYSEALKQARFNLMTKLAEYYVDMSRRLTESDLVDKNERQVYLRRSIARLVALFRGDAGFRHSKELVITAEMWPDIDPADIPYLFDTLDEVLDHISNKEKILNWSDYYGDHYGLDKESVLKSLREFMLYLDTFLEY